MMTSTQPRHRERRGIVLVLILGMLGLLAIIGVTFATFTGQTRVGARNFAQSVNRPLHAEVMDFALSQLVGDTADVRSAIRGHSLARDMYGNDAGNNGYLTARPDGAWYPPYNDSRFYVVNYQQVGTSKLYDILTNIPIDDAAFYGYNFTRWVLKISYTGANPGNVPNVLGTYGKPVDQTFEIVFDNNDPSNALNSAIADGVHRVFRVNPADGTTVLNNPTRAASLNLAAGEVWTSIPAPPNNLAVLPFTLDGRFLRAFNGWGSHRLGVYGNFRYNARLQGFSPVAFTPGEPNFVGLDEDYDACDLENWFLAIQSADGQVVIPSFHRPGILRYGKNTTTGLLDLTLPSDWTTKTEDSMSRILRPRGAENPQFATDFPDPVPNTNPTSPSFGKLNFDVDNDGDGVTDSVWVDLGYPARTDERGQLYKPLFAFLVIGLNGRIPLNTAGNIAGPNQTSASHLGNSPSELDPTYALQNAYDGSSIFTQKDNAGVDVRLTQLRNLLTGTRPASDLLNPDFNANGDANWVQVGQHLDATGAVVPNQIFMPNGQYDASADVLNGVDPASGNPAVVRNTQPVAGRWGEGDLVQGIITKTKWDNPVRAGLSRGSVLGASSFPRDARDDNNNVFDPFPPPRPGNAVTVMGHQGEVLDWDWFDPSGGLILPVERIRRFVTPLDINGTGHVVPFATSPPSAPYKRGGDAFGRVTFFSYFRPPGLPGIIDVNPANATYGAIGDFMSSPRRGVDVTALNRKAGDPAVDKTNNPTHGYDSYRFPPATNPDRLGGMPFNQNSGTKFNTYDSEINGRKQSDGLDDADEMNLYQPDGLDMPFGPGDLEWLYRSHDVDGAQLSSRLKYLAPASFTEKTTGATIGDGLRRRRLFSTDSWEPNRYAWSHDNPSYNMDGTWKSNRFTANSRYSSGANTGFANLNVAQTDITAATSVAYPWLTFLGPRMVNPTNVGNTGFAGDIPHWPLPSPSIAHGERKINLNFPLPVSNDPDEPIRQKWISETYQLLKAILPPKAIDSPEELVQLSQFVVNIVDFRDPDGAMTHFVNPDVKLIPGSVSGGPPPTTVAPTKLAYASAAPTGALALHQFGMEYNPIAINEAMAYSFIRKNGASTTTATPRFFLELVNTLTQSKVGTTSTLNLSGWDVVITGDDAVSRPDPFTGQLLPIASANYYSLIPLSAQASSQPVFTNGGAYTSQDVTLTPLTATGKPTPVFATGGKPPQNFYYVIGNEILGSPTTSQIHENYPPLPNTGSSSRPITGAGSWNGPSLTQALAPAFDPTSATAAPTGAPPTPPPGYDGTSTSPKTNTYPPKHPLLYAPAAKSQNYFWVCLRRPANAFAPPDPNPANASYNPMVVVDCMRFPLIEAGGTVNKVDPADDSKDQVTAGANAIYSVQRCQPYRGGHAVASSTTGTTLDTRYGYSEQMSQPINQPNAAGQFGIFRSSASTSAASRRMTSFIYHTLGAPNDALGASNSQEEPWDYFPFNDRDFTSVAELLLVPGCPPGLFAQQFAEQAPSATFPTAVPPGRGSNGVPSTTIPVAGAPSWGAAKAFLGGTPPPPHNFPYLVDKFYYTPFPLASPTPLFGDRGGDGWFKMFEFFEVPTPADGSIAPIAQGANFDWQRQDLRPGMLNLNLIMDEEPLYAVLGQQDGDFNQQLLNFTPMPIGGTHTVPLSATQLPRVVTATDANGTPLTSYEIGQKGHVYMPNPAGRANFVKAAFAQFLKVRHGGSGFLFAYGQGATGTPNPTYTPAPTDFSHLWVAADRPFRSLSFPDIDFTVMRPATLRPSAYSNPPLNTGTPYTHDPGIRRSALYPGYASNNPPTGLSGGVVVPPAIPTRRLFQNPDAYATSNAGAAGDPYINTQIASLPSATPTTVTTGSLGGTTYNSVNLVSPVAIPPASGASPFLGNADAGGGGTGGQHPFYRTEMLQRVMNLTTVRTHQYAVWITVGFFRVTRQGDPSMAYSPASWALAYDTLGAEVGLPGGKKTRYRSFFIVDRTKLIGFDPSAPGAYRDAVIYRRTIQ